MLIVYLETKDDLTTLEIINLLSIGLQDYDFTNHVPSDVSTNGYFANSVNLKSQGHLDEINTWTINQKIKINIKKTKAMLFYFTRNHQFSTRMKLDNINIELVDEMKILGTIVTFNLSWNQNTQEIIKKVKKNAPIKENSKLWSKHTRNGPHVDHIL